MTSTRSSAVFVIIVSLLALSACTFVDHAPEGGFRNSVFSTQSMPKGYTYQDNTPISSPAPSSPWYRVAAKNNTENISSGTAAWQGAVYELVDKMEPNLPKDGTPLNISSEKSNLMAGAKDNALDHYLRQAFIQRGYNLTTLPETGLQITHKVEKAESIRTYYLTTIIKNDKGDPLFTTKVSAVLPEEE